MLFKPVPLNDSPVSLFTIVQFTSEALETVKLITTESG